MGVHPSAKNILGKANLAFMHGPAHKVSSGVTMPSEVAGSGWSGSCSCLWSYLHTALCTEHRHQAVQLYCRGDATRSICWMSQSAGYNSHLIHGSSVAGYPEVVPVAVHSEGAQHVYPVPGRRDQATHQRVARAAQRPGARRQAHRQVRSWYLLATIAPAPCQLFRIGKEIEPMAQAGT